MFFIPILSETKIRSIWITIRLLASQSVSITKLWYRENDGNILMYIFVHMGMNEHVVFIMYFIMYFYFYANPRLIRAKVYKNVSCWKMTFWVRYYGILHVLEKPKKKTVFWVRSAIQLWFLAQIAQKTHLGHKSVNRPLFEGRQTGYKGFWVRCGHLHWMQLLH